MAKFMAAKEAVQLIKNGDTVATSGFLGMGHPEEISRAVEKIFLETGSPHDLTLTFGASQNDGKGNWGLNRWGKEGLVKRIIAGHWGLQPDMVKLASENKVEAYNFPQGVMMHLYRAISGKKPGILTHVGLKTFVDPREKGGKLNDMTTDDYVNVMKIDGKEYLFYKSFPINVAIIRGTTADEKGNITIEKEGIALEFLTLALAAKACGGVVIAQVERVVKSGTLNAMDVKVPGIAVDAIVVAAPENHWQSTAEPYNASLSGNIKIPLDTIPPLSLNERKIICRRCAMELTPNSVVNLGIGMPEGVGSIAAEEGFCDSLTMSVEPGVIGGVPQGGQRFGCSINPEAMIDHPYSFDFYDGGGLDLTVLGMAEMDQNGNVNVSKFGPKIAGAGGFINITQSTNHVIFCGTMTAGGLKLGVKDGKLAILQEGKIKKLVSEVEQITFSGDYGRENSQKILYVTERAVFELRPEGVTLIEIAPGVDLNKDVLNQMNFNPIISPNLTLMDSRIFREEPMQIKNEIMEKNE